MAIVQNHPDQAKFNSNAVLPYQLRMRDFEMAMQDVYDFFYDVNQLLSGKGLQTLEDTLRPAIMSGFLSDMLTASMAKHSRSLVQNRYFNGHPDLLVQGVYPNNSVKSGQDGVEIKATQKAGGAVDAHGARDQYLCVFVYQVDKDVQKPVADRSPLTFTEVYIAQVKVADFRNNPRGELGTRTSTLDKHGLQKLRAGWVYLDRQVPTAGPAAPSKSRSKPRRKKA
jgi:hypothetical protein